MLRIGMLTSGGDCQALNATMRGVVKGLSANVQELEVYGFYDGYKGLIYGNYRMLSAELLQTASGLPGDPRGKRNTENSKSAA